MNARVAEFHRGPFAALTDNNILHFAKTVRESLTPPIVIILVSILSRKLLAARYILEIAILSDYCSASVWVTHIPRLVELADDLLSWVHCLNTSMCIFDEYDIFRMSEQNTWYAFDVRILMAVSR
jgi:hypothetical protein